MSRNKVSKELIPWLVGVFCLLSLWIFSRYTVDDAFITWRYGENLVKFGIWNYNPSSVDVTQSYTNPIFAALGIVPALLNIDVVVFSKILSTIVTIAAVFFFSRGLSRVGVLTVFCILFMPASVLHSYAGLETFFFVTVIGAMLIAAYEQKRNLAYLLSVILFFTRPESWLLALLLPLYFNHFSFQTRNSNSSIMGRGYFATTFYIEVLVLALCVLVFLLLNYLYFGLPFPNAFYIKVGKNFSSLNLVLFLLCLLPILLLPKENKAFRILCLIFFGAMAVNYSRSELMMDYAGRFAYQILVPLVLLLNYVSNRSVKEIAHSKVESPASGVSRGVIKNFAPLVFSFVFSIFYARSTIGTVLYYPKFLNAHTALALAFKKDIDPTAKISIADAGVVPYISGLNNLDYIGLGSKLIAKTGLSDEALELYKPVVTVLYVDDQNVILSGHNQKIMTKWLDSHNINYVCTVQWSRSSSLAVFSNLALPSVKNVCSSSHVLNSQIDVDGYFKNIMIPPWVYWRSI